MSSQTFKLFLELSTEEKGTLYRRLLEARRVWERDALGNTDNLSAAIASIEDYYRGVQHP